MKKKTLTRAIFLIVFALPVAWYLFLQAFGENKFDLPIYGKFDCGLKNNVLLVDSTRAYYAPNEFQRIRKKIAQQIVLRLELFNADSCALNADVFLLDDQGNLRGSYFMNREDVDRLLAEMDILNINRSTQ